LEATQIVGNRALVSSGGGISNEGNLTMNSGTFWMNVASESGGGLFNTGVVHLVNVAISNGNTAVEQGGGIDNTGSLMLGGGSQVQGNSANEGGGIANSGELNLDGAQVLENSASGNGGGVLNHGQAWIVSSTLENNQASLSGGGIYNGSDQNPAALILENSTLLKNQAWRGGDYLMTSRGSRLCVIAPCLEIFTISTIDGSNGGGIYNAGELDLAFVTLAYNHASEDGGGLFNTDGSSLRIVASIVAYSPTGSNCTGGLTSGGYNLSDDPSCLGFDVADPRLAALADYGGPTLTHYLLAGSPAIDLIPPGDCGMNIDQRLFTRPFGQPCDSGAVDLGISGRLLQIDIRPKTQGNRIDISREGLVPVAILSTEDFNAPAMVAPGLLPSDAPDGSYR